jgi:hypothetical protein
LRADPEEQVTRREELVRLMVGALAGQDAGKDAIQMAEHAYYIACKCIEHLDHEGVEEVEAEACPIYDYSGHPCREPRGHKGPHRSGRVEW